MLQLGMPSTKTCARCKTAPCATQHPNCKYCAHCRTTKKKEAERLRKNAERQADIASRPILPCSKCETQPRASKDPRCLYCRECYWAVKRERQIARIKAHPESKRARERKRMYGLTAEQFDQMFSRQGGACAVCATPFSETLVQVDHNHTTGLVRGLLCRECNLVAGYVEKLQRHKRLATMLAYLEVVNATN